VYLPYVAALAHDWFCTVITQNLGALDTSVTADFKSFDGTKTAQLTRLIPAGGSKFIDPRHEPTLPPGIEYAVTLSSPGPIGAVVNCHNDEPNVEMPRAFSYNGTPATSDSTSFVPYVERNFMSTSTQLIVQNAGTKAATPRLLPREISVTAAEAPVVTGPTLLPGASWLYDLRSNPTLTDGEYSLIVSGGQFATLEITTGPAWASGSTAAERGSTRLYMPNITRTLGGQLGWTTPINLQSTGALNATLKWYRFSDGRLVHTQLLLYSALGQTIRVDPRAIPALSDDTQYAVIATSEAGGISATVTELRGMGGDLAMTYEGLPQPSPTAAGSAYCSPTSGPVGTVFECVVQGLTPGAAISSITFANGGAAPQVKNTMNVVSSDGSFSFRYYPFAAGQYSATLVSNGTTKTANLVVTPRSFPLRIMASTYGEVSAQTSPGVPCSLFIELADGTAAVVPSALNKIANGAGTVSWTYVLAAPVQGTAQHIVSCTSGTETPIVAAPFTVP
jgi:hypothetical protein